MIRFVDVTIPHNDAWYKAKAEYVKKMLYEPVDIDTTYGYKEPATSSPTLARAGDRFVPEGRNTDESEAP